MLIAEVVLLILSALRLLLASGLALAGVMDAPPRILPSRFGGAEVSIPSHHSDDVPHGARCMPRRKFRGLDANDANGNANPTERRESWSRLTSNVLWDTLGTLLAGDASIAEAESSSVMRPQSTRRIAEDCSATAHFVARRQHKMNEVGPCSTAEPTNRSLQYDKCLLWCTASGLRDNLLLQSSASSVSSAVHTSLIFHTERSNVAPSGTRPSKTERGAKARCTRQAMVLCEHPQEVPRRQKLPECVPKLFTARGAGSRGRRGAIRENRQDPQNPRSRFGVRSLAARPTPNWGRG